MMRHVYRKWGFGLVVGGGVVTGLLLMPHTRLQSELPSGANPVAALEYKVFEQPDSTAYTLTIPPGYTIRPFLAETILTVEQVASQRKALAVINAGFFDPVNQKTTSRVVIDGREVASPKDNERLMTNPILSSYLGAILNRSEFRVYQCGTQAKYGIRSRAESIPSGCRLAQAVGGGPQLLPVSSSQQEGFTDYAKGELIRDAIGENQPNARTAIGLKQDGTMVWVMVAQTKANTSGMTLDALANFMKGLGVESALNLDGGTSSSFYYQGQAVYGKRDQHGQPMKRAVRSALVLMASQ